MEQKIETTEKEAVNNLQYVRGNIRNWNHDPGSTYATFSIKVANEARKDETTGAKPPKIKNTYVKVFISGKVLDYVLKNNLHENDPKTDKSRFLEVSGEFEFKSYENKQGVKNTENTLFARTVKAHEFEKGVKNDFEQKYPNYISLKGNLTSDPELITLEAGKTLAKVSVANNISYKDKSGEWKEKVNYVQIEAWDKNADQVKDLKKGEPVILEGYVDNKKFADKEGNNRYSANVSVTKVALDLEVKQARESARAKDPKANEQKQEATSAEKKKDKSAGMTR